MKEIIPLKKDIIFKTKIGEITNINVEHDYKIKDELIEGNVEINGSYKMTEASILEEEFYYSIPFGVAISDRIKKDTIKIDIDDFQYQINKDILKVNIELELTCDENERDVEIEKEEVNNVIDNYFNEEHLEDNFNINEEIKFNNDNINLEQNNNDKKLNYEEEYNLENINQEEYNLDNVLNNNEINEFNIKDNIMLNNNEENINIKEENININNINNITNNIINEEIYHIYKVYIFREGDTLESICNKYNVDMDTLSQYNDLNNIKVGDKLIIPPLDE